MVLDPGAKVGMEAAEYFGITKDTVFEIGLTPNRTDATSHLGVARDIAAVLNHRQKQKRIEVHWPDISLFKVDDHHLTIPVEVEDSSSCPRYSGLTITGIKVGPSPGWIRNLLLSLGIRPINNVVDITNFVLLETGQPLHAFDAEYIDGNRIVVRKARKGEKFITLDEIERGLHPDDLMICNANKGMCIAGVFGGLSSGVTDKTKNIFLESAHFNPTTIRKTSRYHGLQTDASFRFERGSDPNITFWALKRAAMMIKEIAGGAISSEIVDIYPEPIGNKLVTIYYKNVDRLVGKRIERNAIKSILKDLGIQLVKEQSDGLVLSIPTFKVDVTREADVIEEILRIYGYDNVDMPGRLKSSLSFAIKPDTENIRSLVSDMLTSKGYTEVMNNSLTRSKYTVEIPGYDPEENVQILNPLSSDLDVLRQSLLFGGMESIVYNINRKIPDLKIFEFGRIYRYDKKADVSSDALKSYREYEHMAVWMTGRKYNESWNTGNDMVQFYDLKAAVKSILERLGFDLLKLDKQATGKDILSSGLSYGSNGEIFVQFGQVDEKVLRIWDIKQDVYYADFHWENMLRVLAGHVVKYSGVPKFPEVRRDLALVLDKNIPFAELEISAYETEKHILKSVSLFDVYEGDKIPEEKKSYAISFVLRDDKKTLTDNEIEEAMGRILKGFQGKFGAEIR
jgi:phenylalanyl-tRNA synthetase beta chain